MSWHARASIQGAFLKCCFLIFNNPRISYDRPSFGLDRCRPRGPTQSGGQTHAGRAPLDSLNPTCAGRTHNAASKRLSDVWNLNLCARRCASLSRASSSRHSRKPGPLPGPNCHDHARHLTHAGQPANCLRRDLDSMVARHDEGNAGSGGSGNHGRSCSLVSAAWR